MYSDEVKLKNVENYAKNKICNSEQKTLNEKHVESIDSSDIVNYNDPGNLNLNKIIMDYHKLTLKIIVKVEAHRTKMKSN